MHICILISSNEGNELNPDMCPELYLEMMGHSFDKVIIAKKTAVSQIVSLSKRGYDVFLNLCDGAWDEDRSGIEVVQALERLNVPFTGGNTVFYDPTREDMKKTAIYFGVNTPNYKLCWNTADVTLAAETLLFPVIAKHFCSYNSIGMTKDSKCTNAAGLMLEASRFISTYGGCLVEEFIDGGEYTVLVAENPCDLENPIVYPPVVCSMPPGEDFKHYALKWLDYNELSWTLSSDEILNHKLVEMSKTMFCAMRGVGFGRLDIRVDNRTGTPYFLEINPNCSIFYPKGQFGSADTILELTSKKITESSDDHSQFLIFLQNIIDAGIAQWRKKQLPFTVEYNGKTKGFGMFANRLINIGEVVDKIEEEGVHLVSRTHVDSTWNEQKKLWFRQYCWPMNDTVFAMWSPSPSKWHPINHSCDPNTWLSGLNTTARRNIKTGEELTIDYATFCVGLEPFQCFCGSTECRGFINGLEYREPGLLERYGDHVSGYILMERQKMTQQEIVSVKPSSAQAKQPTTAEL